MRLHSLVLAALLATSAIPAHAGYTTIDYTGYVSVLYPADGGQVAPADIFLGQTVSISVTVDLSRMVSFGTFTLPNGSTGAPMVVHPAGISLFDDPGASYIITMGSHVWTQLDETADDNGYVTPTGVGPNPFLAYDGSPSQLIGLSSDAVNAEGLEFFSNPADYFLQDARRPVYGGGVNDGDFGFAVNTSLDLQIQAIRAQALAAGQVPEPSTVLMLLLGVVCMGLVSRRKVDSGRGLTGLLSRPFAAATRSPAFAARSFCPPPSGFDGT